MSSQLNDIIRVEIPNYGDESRVWATLNPAKAAKRCREGWTLEKTVIRHLANGNDEHLCVVSMPHPPKPPPPPVVVKKAEVPKAVPPPVAARPQVGTRNPFRHNPRGKE